MNLTNWPDLSKTHILFMPGVTTGTAKTKRASADLDRRNPKQARALETVEIIFQATTRILQQDGLAALNTNFIAERAGISIGTLYQYFPNKEAILVAMARREIETSGNALLKAIAEASSDPQIDLARHAIRVLIATFARQRKVRQILIDTLVAQGFGAELEQNLQKVVQVISSQTERFLPGRKEPLPPATLFVITRGVSGALRAASQEQPALLGLPEFEDALVLLVRAYLERL
jgi:AcrR family transcriptional regulator